MEIKTRRCDACHKRFDSDAGDYYRVQTFTAPAGDTLDICEPCIDRLMMPGRTKDSGTARADA